MGEKLYEAGIEARLDQWFVTPGVSFTAFMEQEVEAADFVLVVCTPSYAHKSNNRQGGVGYEQQIVSGRLMAGTERSKFIPILRNGEYEPGAECAIPTHFIGIAWIDFRNEAFFEESLEDLVRVIFSKPRFAPPPIGTPPYLETVSATKLNQTELAETEWNRTSLDSNEEKNDRVESGPRKADDTAAKISDAVHPSPNFQTSNILKPFNLEKRIQSHSLFLRFLQRKKTIAILISLLLVVAVFSATLWRKGGSADDENRVKELVQQGKDHFDRGDYENLSKINTGQSLEYIEDIFGKPTIRQTLSSNEISHWGTCRDNTKRNKFINLSRYQERIYVTPLFILQIITNKEGRVIFYAVTTRSRDFNPPLPKTFSRESETKELRLGKAVFGDIPIASLVSFFWSRSTEHILYEEQYYFIRTGKQYFLAFTAAGYNYDNDFNFFETVDKHRCNQDSRFGFQGSIDPSVLPSHLAGIAMEGIVTDDIKSSRAHIKPNTYAVGEDYDDEVLRYFYQREEGIGASYGDIRSLEK